MNPCETDSVTDDQLSQFVRQGELVPLLAALAYLTGDRSFIDPELRPKASSVLGRTRAGEYSDESEVHRRALQGLRGIAGIDRVPSTPSGRAPAIPREYIEYIVGEPIDDETEEMLRYQLGIPHDQGKPQWTSEAVSSGQFSVAVIGAGMSGLVMARRLDQAGIPYTVFERNQEIGGVWYENTYPGCRVDTTNYIYSYSFAMRSDWSHDYSLRNDVYKYLNEVAAEFGVVDRVRLGSEVLAATFQADSCRWRLSINGPEGPYEAEFSAVVSAVGQLNRPKFPDLPGIDTFAGPSFHTARWDHSIDLRGKRVAVVGTGASAYQVIPEIADLVESLTIFQRNAPWMEPTPAYADEVRPGLRWLFDNVPTYANWYRMYQFWITADARRPYYLVDPTWNKPGSVSAKNEELREHLVNALTPQYADRDDLLAMVIPSYPPYAKRLLRDNGLWAATLHKPHVRLRTDAICGVDATGIATANEHIDTDVIIYATGFKASELLQPIEITGVNGAKLHEQWAGDPSAYLGISVPNFPNLFCLYGPNTNVVVSSSLFFFSECATNFVLSALKYILESGGDALECNPEALARFTKEIDEASLQTAWGASDVESWYKSESGRVSQNWPLRVVDYWARTRVLPKEDFHLLRASTDARAVGS